MTLSSESQNWYTLYGKIMLIKGVANSSYMTFIMFHNGCKLIAIRIFVKKENVTTPVTAVVVA